MSVVAIPSAYQSPRNFAMKGRTASPITHQIQPEMKAHLRPLSSQISATMVYLQQGLREGEGGPALTPPARPLGRSRCRER